MFFFCCWNGFDVFGQKVVDGRLFSGSFDSTLRIWTVSDLRAEDDPGKEKNKDDEDPLAEP